MFKRVLAGILFSIAALALPAVADAGRVPKPTPTIETPGQCVAPVEEMRRNHMEMLKHQRNRTMRMGERDAKVSLNGCIQCHASKTNGSVLGSRDNFCETCHAFAAVKLDCWDCHQPKANYKATASAPPTMGLKP
jgi:hypothetical protein